jgi:hypothetical protein
MKRVPPISTVTPHVAFAVSGGKRPTTKRQASGETSAVVGQGWSAATPKRGSLTQSRRQVNEATASEAVNLGTLAV